MDEDDQAERLFAKPIPTPQRKIEKLDDRAQHGLRYRS